MQSLHRYITNQAVCSYKLVNMLTAVFFFFFLNLISFVQLLGQFENTGPPPAEKEKISSLPTVIVSQEQAGQSRFYFSLPFLIPKN